MFTLYAEIQNGCQKCEKAIFRKTLQMIAFDLQVGNQFLEKSVCGRKNLVEIALSHTISPQKCVFELYAEIQIYKLDECFC